MISMRYIQANNFVFSSFFSVIFNLCDHGCDDTWWRHQMETFSALLVLCAGNLPVPVNSLHKGQWRGALMFCLICARINDWVNKREAGDLRRHRGHYDVIVMTQANPKIWYIMFQIESVSTPWRYVIWTRPVCEINPLSLSQHQWW